MFGLNGIGGMLIAVVLLLSIVGFLGTSALLTQQNNASNYYKIDGEKEIKMIDAAAKAKVVDAK
ncbi:MAG: DUF4006 family protein [Campylobacterales bacterium]